MSTFGTQQQKIPGIKKIIGVLSGKGGVGKTFFATNLALVLAKNGCKTGLLDADICCPTVFKMLGITEKLIPTVDKKIIPIEKWGVKALSMAGLCASDDEPVVWRGPIISKILQQFLKETIWGELDLLVIDLPTGSSDSVLTILQQFAVDGVILVSTPQEMAITGSRRTLNMAALMKTPVLGLVENMRGDVFGEGSVSRIAQMYHTPFLGSIPLRKQIVTFSDQGIPASMQLEEIGMIFNKIARHILNATAQTL